MNNKVNLTEETNRMRNLFGYKAGKVISEQEITSSNTLNEQYGTSFGQTYGGGADQDDRLREKLQGIADKKNEALANNNMVTDNGVQMKWTDYIVKNNIQPGEIKAAEQLNATANTDLKKQQDRYQNIVKTIDSVDDNGIIQSSTPRWKGKSWVDFANQYKISQDEINKAKEYVKTAPPVVNQPAAVNPAVAKPAAAKQVVNPTPPRELGDVNGVKQFQKWLNTQDPTWVNGKPLELDPKCGYGRFGPLTTASWNKLKDTYLKEIGSLKANQKVVAKPELASTAVAPAQGAKITEPVTPAASTEDKYAKVG